MNSSLNAYHQLDQSLEHWRIRQDNEGIVWLACDRAGETSNALSEAVIRELNECVVVLKSKSCTGLVIESAKADSFILGADIKEFDHFTEAKEVSEKISQGHEVFSALEALPFTTVAAVKGYCLGGGLELALCCDYLIADSSDKTRLGLPEVKLGIFPGLGGTTRLTERLGGAAAMPLMLSGRILRARAAKKIGIVDQLVDEFSSLHWAARKAVLQKRIKRSPSLLQRASNTRILRYPLAQLFRKKTAEKISQEHYPAPFKMIDLWSHRRSNRPQMFAGEAQLVGELMVSPTAQHLRRIFFLSERMKSLGKNTEFNVSRVHVVGAGVMGADIAAWCALQGMEVTLQDLNQEVLDQAIKRVDKLFVKRTKTRAELSATRSRLIADSHGKGVGRADVVIEAIIENLEAKKSLYATLEKQLRPHAILATNTSALPLQDLSAKLQKPDKLIGLHFFNPVAKMPLVEVVHSKVTEKIWIDRACAFCTQINRFPLPAYSAPGFLVNRVLAPYIMEAISMMIEGRQPEAIDAAAIAFGMPMGPIELADTVGLDICMDVAKTLAKGDVEAHRKLLDEKIAKKQLGKKSDHGFYQWKKSKPVKQSLQLSPGDQQSITERLLKPFLNECQAVSNEGIVGDDDLLDAGIIFGTGFAPFRGGPLHYLKHQVKETP